MCDPEETQLTLGRDPAEWKSQGELNGKEISSGQGSVRKIQRKRIKRTLQSRVKGVPGQRVFLQAVARGGLMGSALSGGTTRVSRFH